MPTYRQKPPQQSAKSFLSIRVDAEQKALVVQAAEREGLQLSSFIIMLLVRLHILPDSCLKSIKRRPVPFFNALHGLLGVVNKIGGICKQLAVAFPEMDGLHQTHTQIVLAASAITDALQGTRIPEGVNLYRLQTDITQRGRDFNSIVKSVNSGKPNLAGLPTVLNAITDSADTITAALTNGLLKNHETLTDRAMSEMRANMQKAPTGQTQPQSGDT